MEFLSLLLPHLSLSLVSPIFSLPLLISAAALSFSPLLSPLLLSAPPSPLRLVPSLSPSPLPLPPSCASACSRRCARRHASHRRCSTLRALSSPTRLSPSSSGCLESATLSATPTSAETTLLPPTSACTSPARRYSSERTLRFSMSSTTRLAEAACSARSLPAGGHSASSSVLRPQLPSCSLRSPSARRTRAPTR